MKKVTKPKVGTTVVVSVCRGTNSIVVKIISKWKEIQHTDPKVFTAYAVHEEEITMIDTTDFEHYDYAEGWLDGDVNDPEIKKALRLSKKTGFKFPYQEILETWDVLDALRGRITGNYQKDLGRLNKQGKTVTENLYQIAYQMDMQH